MTFNTECSFSIFIATEGGIYGLILYTTHLLSSLLCCEILGRAIFIIMPRKTPAELSSSAGY